MNATRPKTEGLTPSLPPSSMGLEWPPQPKQSARNTRSAPSNKTQSPARPKVPPISGTGQSPTPPASPPFPLAANESSRQGRKGGGVADPRPSLPLCPHLLVGWKARLHPWGHALVHVSSSCTLGRLGCIRLLLLVVNAAAAAAACQPETSSR